MTDKPKIVAGLVVFLVLATCPFWYAQVGAILLQKVAPLPNLESPTDGSHCVEDADWMKGHHMELLDQWRNEVIRGDGTQQDYQSRHFSKMKPCVKSLSKTCLGCHTMQADRSDKRSCVQCHEYANVHPRCMDCHVEPKPKEN